MRNDLRNAGFQGNAQDCFEIVQVNAACRFQCKIRLGTGGRHGAKLFFTAEPLHREVFERIAAHIAHQRDRRFDRNDRLVLLGGADWASGNVHVTRLPRR
ncbi:hypothetical protein D3C81_2068020 [compost metagenome]